MIDDERATARDRSRQRRERERSRRRERNAEAAATERAPASFSVEEFEARHANERPDPGATPIPGASGATEPIEVEAEVVFLDTEPDAGREGATSHAEADPGHSASPGRARDIEERQAVARDVVHLDDPAEVLPALAKVAADIWMRAAIWGIESSLRTGARMMHAAVDPEAAAELYQDLSGGLRDYAREFLGVTELDNQVRQLGPLAGATLPQTGERPEIALRERGAELLRQAADVSLADGVHPAYARILTELAPDEARILRTLAVDGPQPMVDIRETNLIGMGSQLIRSELNMIAAQAGLRFRDRVAAYLGNLLRLGLIELSDAAVEDAIAYQVLEAQPEVLSTIKETPRAKTIHRSIRLTPFGDGFCRVCLPLGATAEPSSDVAAPPDGDLA